MCIIGWVMDHLNHQEGNCVSIIATRKTIINLQTLQIIQHVTFVPVQDNVKSFCIIQWYLRKHNLIWLPLNPLNNVIDSRAPHITLKEGWEDDEKINSAPSSRYLYLSLNQLKIYLSIVSICNLLDWSYRFPECLCSPFFCTITAFFMSACWY